MYQEVIKKGGFVMIRQIFVLNEQVRQIQIHKWIESEKNQRDMSEEAVRGWVEKYASGFRKWSNSIPELCLNCGCNCQKDSSECIQPFNDLRLQKLRSMGEKAEVLTG